MDDIFNILFFVATIIVFVISAIRKSKGANKNTNSNVSTTIESLFGLSPEDNSAEVNNFAQQVSTVPDVTPEPAEPKIGKQETNVRKAAVPNVIKDTEISDTEKTRVDFDLRSAIIYKEILNRKDF